MFFLDVLTHFLVYSLGIEFFYGLPNDIIIIIFF